MRKFFCAMFVAASLAVPIYCQSPIVPVDGAAHQIELVTKTADVGCSSTAVGPHTLLSAAHCIIGTGGILVDDAHRHILNTIYDENDHVLLVVDGTSFPETRQIEQRDPIQNEHVRICGWPGDATKAVCRDGIFKSIEQAHHRLVWQLPVFGGDSGSGLVANNGKVINVVSLGNDSAEMENWPLAFSANQLQEIK